MASKVRPPASVESESGMAEVFYGLAVLACPVGMGVMMWMMMRGGRRPDPTGSTPDSELATLRAELEQLRDAQHGEATPAARRSGIGTQP